LWDILEIIQRWNRFTFGMFQSPQGRGVHA
jgi:hypothetical protein